MSESNELHTITTIDKRPFKHFCITIGELPSSFVDSMSYYELTAWLCQYLESTVIPAVNENGAAVEELQDLYIQLHDYVEHYFENLDVQEEINNKLDQMAESGELTDLIAAYLNLRGILAYDTVASMKSADNLVDGSFAETYGFYAKGDGGGAKYQVRTVTNEDVVDEMFIIALSDNTLIAELICDGVLDLRKIGAKADGSADNSSIVNMAISKTYIKKLIMPGTNKISNGLTIGRQLEIDLQGGTIDASDLSSGAYLFTISTRYDDKFIIKNGNIIGNDNVHFIKNTVSGTTWGYSFDLDSLEIIHFEKIVDGYNIYNSMITNCVFSSNNGYFVYDADTMTNQNTFRNCYFKSYNQDSAVYPDYKFVLTKAKNWLFDQCSFEQQKTSIKATNSSQITVKSCEFEQQNYVANDDGAVNVDGTNYLYGLVKAFENYTFLEDAKLGNVFSNVHTLDENDTYIRHTIRHASTTSGGDSFGLTSAGSGWVPIMKISPKEFNFYQPVNTVQVKSSGAVSSQTIDITNFNKGSSRDTYIIYVYTVVKGASQSTHRMWRTPIVHVNSYTTKIGEPELVYTADWSGQTSYSTTITVTINDNTITVTPSQSVELYSFAKAEYLGDNLW